jgi:DNA primase catalytic core
MARIPETEIERLKLTVSLVRLVEGAGIALAAHGKDLIARCPFHDDRTPSLVISPKANLWHCLGACQAGGSVIDWVMRWQKVSFRHAVALLQQDAPLARDAVDARRSAPEGAARRVSKQRPAADLAAHEDDQALLDQIVGFYHDNLKQSPEALAYLDQRGLGSMELIEHFRLGFANRTLGYRLPTTNTQAGAAVRGQLQRIGLIRASGHEHFAGSLVIPVLDAEGRATEVYGRKITPALRRGTPLHLYLPGPHQGVFNRAGIEGAQEVILCEALIDALTFWRAGYRQVTSSYGVNGFTEDLLAALKICGAKRILIAYDRDEAGDAAAAALAPRLQAAGLEAFRLVFPRDLDANAYALSAKPAEQSLGVVIRNAQWLGDGVKPTLTSRCFNSVHQWVDGEEVARTVASSSERQSATPVELPSLAAEPSPSSNEHPPSEPQRDALPVLAASAVPPAPSETLAAVSERQVEMTFGDRRYRVRGFAKNTSYEVMKVNVLVAVDTAMHVDTVDLYAAKHRQAYARAAASELGVEESVIQRDLGHLLLKLEQLQDARLEDAMKPKAPVAAAMTEAEHAAALAFLRDPKLIERIVADFDRIGLVGEAANTLVGYLACVSRKLAAPLAVIIQSTSAAGKSTLMDAALALVPEEDRVHYSAMTGQSLFYLGETSVKHKILAIAEEEGVRQAAYALKVLQSQGELTIASTGKDPATGQLVTQEYRVEGPVMLFLTTTAIDIDEELMNRCLVLTIDESREQTRAIQQRQRARRTLSGLIARREQDAVLTRHRHAQRLLRPLAVVNPYAEQLTFLDDRTRTRRDHAKYLTLIEAIALLHQYQRPVKQVGRGTAGDGPAIEYIEVELSDIALANRLAHEVLGRSLDELPPQTRRLLGAIASLVEARIAAQALPRSEVRLTRKEIRDVSGLSDTRLRLHLDRLVEMEYLFAHAGRQGRRFVYELAFDGKTDTDAPQLIGLLDVAALEALQARGTTTTSPGSDPHFAPSSPAVSLSLAPRSPGAANGLQPFVDAACSASTPLNGQNVLFPDDAHTRSRSSSLAAALP